MPSHGEEKTTSGAVDLANADATTTANKANGARLTAHVFKKLSARGKELKRHSRARIALYIVSARRTANDAAMIPSTNSAEWKNSKGFGLNEGYRTQIA